MDKIKAILSGRDSPVWQDDDVVLVLCPKAGSFYKIEVNPIGAIYDWKNGDAQWNGNWVVKTSIEKDKWIVEMAISFDDLDIVLPEANSIWRVNFCRQQKPKGEVSIFSGVSINEPANSGVCIF